SHLEKIPEIARTSDQQSADLWEDSWVSKRTSTPAERLKYEIVFPLRRNDIIVNKSTS
ncbi:unnamed protein product, partial [Nesidiocoris tenuis]